MIMVVKALLKDNPEREPLSTMSNFATMSSRKALETNAEQLDREMLPKVVKKLLSIESLEKGDKIKNLCEFLMIAQNDTAFKLGPYGEKLSKLNIENESENYFVVLVINFLNSLKSNFTGDKDKQTIEKGIKALESYQGRKVDGATSESSDCSYI